MIDPGSDDPDHVDAIVGCGGDRIRWVLVTSTARDHAEGAAAVAARTGAEVLGFAATDGFVPDVEIGEGYELEATEFRLLALHTPGHGRRPPLLPAGGRPHALSRATWCGATDRRWRSPRPTSTRPPSWRRSSACRSRRLRLRGIAPGHGHLIDDASRPPGRVPAHRLEREAPSSPPSEAGAATVERAGRRRLRRPAPACGTRPPTVHAHLLKLAADGRAAGADGAWHPGPPDVSGWTYRSGARPDKAAS